MSFRRHVLLATLALAACGKHRIPGTEIRDTPDARAIYELIETYRQAAERREPEAIVALASPQYFDDAGTPDPADDLDYGQLQKAVPAHFQKLAAVRLGITVKDIRVEGDRAFANVFYDSHYRIATATGETPKQASDVSQMRFVREDGKWKFTSGL